MSQNIEDQHQELLERVITYVLNEAESLNGYPEECIAFLKGVDAAKIAKNIDHIENLISLVYDVVERSSDAFDLWKNDKDYADYEDFLPQARWMHKGMFNEYPLRDLQKEFKPLFKGVTNAFLDYPYI